MVVAEIEHNGRAARIVGTAATENDDAIQFIVDVMAREGISGDRVLSLYSERQPPQKWYDYIAPNWPKAAITWSFAPGEDAKMDAEVDKLLATRRKPWWKFW